MRGTQALTDCNQKDFEFQELGPRRVVADFSGGQLSSDGGTLLLRELDARLGLSRKLGDCFVDLRDQRWVQHDLATLVAQRVRCENQQHMVLEQPQCPYAQVSRPANEHILP